MEEEETFELIEYFDDSRKSSTGISSITASNSSGSESEQQIPESLTGNGEYFICYDVVQNKITGYFKQDFMKNC